MGRKKKTNPVTNSQTSKRFKLLKKAMSERLPRFAIHSRRVDASGIVNAQTPPLAISSKSEGESKETVPSIPDKPLTDKISKTQKSPKEPKKTNTGLKCPKQKRTENIDPPTKRIKEGYNNVSIVPNCLKEKEPDKLNTPLETSKEQDSSNVSVLPEDSKVNGPSDTNNVPKNCVGKKSSNSFLKNSSKKESTNISTFSLSSKEKESSNTGSVEGVYEMESNNRNISKNSQLKETISTNVVKFIVSMPSSDNTVSELVASQNSVPAITKSTTSSTIISSTFCADQGTLKDMIKEDSLQQLSTNALPVYVPKSPPNFSGNPSFPSEYHGCTECGDMFMSNSSLAFHLDRRSVYIKLPCKSCGTIKFFYNRCALLKHVRAHKDRGEESNMESAVVVPIPKILMNAMVEETSNPLEEENAEDMAMSPTDMVECSLGEMNEDNETSQSPEEQICQIPTIPKKYKCLDCGEDFTSQEERAHHMVNIDAVPSAAHRCTKCSIVCPSKCSLKAHQRIHLQVSPYVCPECGDSPDPHWSSFQNHVNHRCFHNSRIIGYCCPVCKRVFANTEALHKHMDMHTEKYIKCEMCPRAYMTYPAFKSHIVTYHQNSEPKVPWKMIYKCALCEVVFLSTEQMLAHRSSHIKEDKVCKYFFNCMQCGKSMSNKMELYDHIRLNHPKVFKAYVMDHTIVQKETFESTGVFKGKVECLLCHSSFYSQQGYYVHISRAHININQQCTCCYVIISSRKVMVDHGKAHLQNKSIICLLCNNAKFPSPTHLDAHLKQHIDKLKNSTFCPLCKIFLTTRKMAHMHLRKEHLLAPVSSAATSAIAEPSSASCHFCRLSFDDGTMLQEHLKTRHNINDSGGPDNAAIFGISVQSAESKSVQVGDVCVKCSYSSSDRIEFKKHILTHKQHKYSYQCQACGTCYIVESALLKHLIMAHRIKEPQKYVDEEGTNHESDYEDQNGVSEDSQICSVCFIGFPDEASLKTHMRSHGMAFIRTKQSTAK